MRQIWMISLKAEKDLADLKNGSEAEKAELQKQINSLKEQLNEANAKVTVLKAEKERLTEEKHPCRQN